MSHFGGQCNMRFCCYSSYNKISEELFSWMVWTLCSVLRRMRKAWRIEQLDRHRLMVKHYSYDNQTNVVSSVMLFWLTSMCFLAIPLMSRWWPMMNLFEYIYFNHNSSAQTDQCTSIKTKYKTNKWTWYTAINKSRRVSQMRLKCFTFDLRVSTVDDYACSTYIYICFGVINQRI